MDSIGTRIVTRSEEWTIVPDVVKVIGEVGQSKAGADPCEPGAEGGTGARRSGILSEGTGISPMITPATAVGDVGAGGENFDGGTDGTVEG